MAKYDLQITYLPKEKGKPAARGIAIEISEDEFFLAGTGFSPVFLPKRGEPVNVDFVK